MCKIIIPDETSPENDYCMEKSKMFLSYIQEYKTLERLAFA